MGAAMSTSITDRSTDRSKSRPFSISKPKPKNTKLLLREIRPGILSEKGRVKVVLNNGETYSIDASRIKSISYIPNQGYVVDYETEHTEFYEEKRSIADPNDPMLKLAIPLRFKVEGSIETVYFCPFCGRELEAEEDADDIAYRCRVHGYEWEWDKSDWIEYVGVLEAREDEPKPIRKEVERKILMIEPINIDDIENLIARFADIEEKWVGEVSKELKEEYPEEPRKFTIPVHIPELGIERNYNYSIAAKEIKNEKYIVVEIEKEGISWVERAVFKVRVRDQELFNMLFRKEEEAKQKIEKTAPVETVKHEQEKIEKKIEEPKEPEISFEEAVKIARSKIPDWADGIVFVKYESCGGYLDQYDCGYVSKALPVRISRKPGSLFYTSVTRWRSIDLGEHSSKIFKHLTNKLVTKDEIYEIELVDSSFERKDYYDLKLKNMEDILKKRKIEKFEDLVSEIDRILPEWSIGVYVSRENDRYVVRMVAEYPSRDYDYYYKENWVVNLDVPEDLLKQLEGKVILRSGKVVEVERAGKRPSDKIKLNIKEG
jgi:DNA-directed RNA polymerase subunit M/transcription elongation factor TFIIS